MTPTFVISFPCTPNLQHLDHKHNRALQLIFRSSVTDQTDQKGRAPRRIFLSLIGTSRKKNVETEVPKVDADRNGSQRAPEDFDEGCWDRWKPWQALVRSSVVWTERVSEMKYCRDLSSLFADFHSMSVQEIVLFDLIPENVFSSFST